jgi:SAM-dependent methyltransferase
MSASNEPVDELLAAAYAVDGPDANRALYARWAATYDTGFIVDSGYLYHERVARIFAARCVDALPADDVVVDIGCGTGLAGQSLRQLFRVAIDGIDISPEMLQHAAGKHVDGQPVYRRLIEADLTRPLPIDDDSYAGAISTGTFTHGHVGPNALHELVRIIRPGGRIAVGINAAHYVAHGFAATLDELTGAGRIGALELIDVPIYDASEIDDPDKVAHVAVCAVS